MVDVTVSVQRDHIHKLTRPSQPVRAVIELIWNSLDADAKNVKVRIGRNELGGVDAVTVTDDGIGIPYSSCPVAFERLGGSWKAAASYTEKARRPLHGQSGEGRFRAFALGTSVKWTTIADDVDGRYKCSITADSSFPERFSISDAAPTRENTGTSVRIVGSPVSLNTLITDNALVRITREFARLLRRYPDVSIVYDESTIDPDAVIDRIHTETLTSPDKQDPHPPTIEIVEWSQDFPREIILCDGNGFALTEYRPRIQAPDFSFAAYVSWHGFHGSEIFLADLGHERYQPLLDSVREYLREYFRERAKERTADIVESWKSQEVYPFHGSPSSSLDEAKRDLFNLVAVQALPGIPEDIKPKKLSLRLLREAIEHSPSALKAVMSDVLELSDQQLDDLASLLDRTSLGSVISAAQAVSERLDFLRSLELLLFDSRFKSEVLERSQLHRILAAEPWVFGELYALSVDDQSIKEVLHRHLQHLDRDTLNLADVRLEDRSTAIVDLMLSKTIQDSERQHHLIVELKRPTTRISYKERQQIESYAMAIAGDERFKGAGTTWDFVLVGNDLSDDIRKLSNKKGQPFGLIHDDDDLDLRIWIRHWGSIIEERRRALHFYKESLEVDPSRDDAVDFLRRKYAEFLPASMVHPDSEAS